jgi:hypothetical protein
MPRYYVTSPETALGISAIKAQQMGCAGVTFFWWNVINHPTNGGSAIVFQDEECALAPDETFKVLYLKESVQITTNDLNTQVYMKNNGWFPAGSGL